MADPQVAVLVPWRPGCPDREAAWNHLKPRWPWPVVEGTPPAGPWCKAAAVATALDRTDAEILVIADADVWTDGVGDAVRMVADGAPWAIPHLTVRRLDPAATKTVLTGGELGGQLAERPYVGHAGGGIVILTRQAYLQVPLDPRFTGWGQEDDAWAIALRCLLGPPWRGTAPLWHLYHPPQVRETRIRGSRASHALYQRYRRVRRDPAAMAALIAEARQEVTA